MATGTSALAAAGGPIGLGVTAGLAGLSGIVSLFKGHSQAVQNEAAALNSAVPQFAAQIQAIVDALNNGKIDEATANQGIDLAVQQYFSNVSGSFRGALQGTSPEPKGDCSPPSNDPKQYPNCNGPCFVGGYFVKPLACKVKAIIRAGEGTATSNALVAHAGFSGLPSFSVTYKRPVNIAGFSLTSTNAKYIGIGTLAFLAIGGALLKIRG